MNDLSKPALWLAPNGELYLAKFDYGCLIVVYEPNDPGVLEFKDIRQWSWWSEYE